MMVMINTSSHRHSPSGPAECRRLKENVKRGPASRHVPISLLLLSLTAARALSSSRPNQAHSLSSCAGTCIRDTLICPPPGKYTTPLLLSSNVSPSLPLLILLSAIYHCYYCYHNNSIKSLPPTQPSLRIPHKITSRLVCCDIHTCISTTSIPHSPCVLPLLSQSVDQHYAPLLSRKYTLSTCTSLQPQSSAISSHPSSLAYPPPSSLHVRHPPSSLSSLQSSAKEPIS